MALNDIIAAPTKAKQATPKEAPVAVVEAPAPATVSGVHPLAFLIESQRADRIARSE